MIKTWEKQYVKDDLIFHERKESDEYLQNKSFIDNIK